MDDTKYVLYINPLNGKPTWVRCDTTRETDEKMAEIRENPARTGEILVLADGDREMTEPEPGRYPTDTYVACWQFFTSKSRGWARFNGFRAAAETVDRIIGNGGFAAMWNESRIDARYPD